VTEGVPDFNSTKSPVVEEYTICQDSFVWYYLRIMKRKANPQGYNVVVFDCDSTLSAVEGIDLLAEKYGVKKEVEKITHHAMNGHSNFADALAFRLQLVRPCKSDMKWLGGQYIEREVPGTKELVTKLKKLRKKVFIISGGFDSAIKIFASHIGVKKSNVLCNSLLFDKSGKYRGFDNSNPLSKNHGKKIVLKQITKLGSTVFVGDGVTDLEAKNVVDLFVGFGGVKVREVVKRESDIFIDDNTLLRMKDIAIGKNIAF